MIYLDTCVLVAYYWPEPLSRAAQREIRKAGSPAISPLNEVEFFSALKLKTRTGEIDEASARRVGSAFRLHRADGVYRVVPIAAREYVIACEWLGVFCSGLRALDALHLAVASSNGLTLVTADKALAEAASQFHVRCRLLS